MACDPSVLPLSATMISPETPISSMARRAFVIQQARVCPSFKQGRTTESSTDSGESEAAFLFSELIGNVFENIKISS